MTSNFHKDIVDQEFTPEQASARFTLAVTIKNEADNIERFMNSVAMQTRQPDDFIIVDGGSTDNTTNIIRKHAKLPAKPRLIVSKGASPAHGRNMGIRNARYDLIVMLDAGCEASDKVLANLVGPMSADKPPDMTGGIYYAKQVTRWTPYFVPNWENTSVYDSFLPSARCVAFWRPKAIRIGMFPEYLKQRWGEDTLFDLRYREVSDCWVINKAAFVVWDAPTSERQAVELAEHYGWGNGEIGTKNERFDRALAAGIRFADPVIEAGCRGYQHGRSLRENITA